MVRVRLRRISVAESLQRDWSVVIAKTDDASGRKQDQPAVLEYLDEETGTWTEVEIQNA